MTAKEIHEKLMSIVIPIDDSIPDIDPNDPYIKKKNDEAIKILKKYKLPDEYYAQLKKEKKKKKVI
jgi:hypothetical protein